MRNPLACLAVAALLSVGSAAATPLDGSDAFALDVSFLEMIADLSEIDKRKAAAAVLLIADDRESPDARYLKRIRADALVLVGDGSGDMRGAILADVAENGSALTGMTGEQLVAHYDTVSAAAAEGERQANVTERAEQIERLEARRTALEEDRAANAARRAELTALIDASAPVSDADEMPEMAGAVRSSGRGFQRLSRGVQGQFLVDITNETDAAIRRPYVVLIFTPIDSPLPPLESRTVGLYKSEKRRVEVAPGETTAFDFYTSPVRPKDGDMADYPESTGDYALSARIMSYRLAADGSVVERAVPGEREAELERHEAALAVCDEADAAIEVLDETLSGRIAALNEGGEADRVAKIETRC